MTDATQWTGLTTENHIRALYDAGPQKLDELRTVILGNSFGMNLDNMLSKFPTLTVETSDDYTWTLESQSLNNINLIEARIDGVPITPADEPGRNKTTFEMVFPQWYFFNGETILGEKLEKYIIRIIGDPVMDGLNYVYTCTLMGKSMDDFVPYEELVRDKRFTVGWSPVERTMSRKGGELRHKGVMSMRNDFTTIRLQKVTPGNMIGKKIACLIEDDKTISSKIRSRKAPLLVWENYESMQMMNEFREQSCKAMMFGTSNRFEDGTYKDKGDSGYEIRTGSGIREQMESANDSFYNQFSLKALTRRLNDLAEGKLRKDERDIVLKTGERGATQFHEAIEANTQLYTPLQNSSRVYGVSTDINSMGMGYGGQFVQYKAPNNLVIGISVDSYYGDRSQFMLLHPNGGTAESYRYDIMDLGTVDGKPNIQKVRNKEIPTAIHKSISGLRSPFDPKEVVSPVDKWEEHIMDQFGILLRDPSRTLSFKPNILN